MKKVIFILFIAGIILIAISWYAGRETYEDIGSFEECVKAGNPVMESYPRKCRAPGGEAFVETIPRDIQKADLIHVTAPVSEARVTSPLRVSGEARGNWYFEATFPVQIVDANGTVIVETYAEAQSDWMTVEFVPFLATIVFDMPATATGEIVLQKSNPSGLPEHYQELRIPVTFFDEPIATEEVEGEDISSELEI